MAASLGSIATEEAASSPFTTQRASPLFRSGVELVALNVSVVDRRQRFVEGLRAGDFSVYENGVQREVAFFGPASLPLDVAILLDISASMRPQINLVREGALSFVRQLRPQDRAEIIGFADGPNVLQSLTSDIVRLQDAVDHLHPAGSTAIYDALYITADHLGRERAARDEIRRQALVLLSDGVDTVSIVGGDDALTAVRRAGVSVYAISPMRRFVSGDPEVEESHRAAAFMLTTLARDTGGRMFFVPNLYALDRVFTEIAGELRHQYTLAFEPDDVRWGTGMRALSVRVSRPNVVVRTRRSYDPARH